MTRWPVSLPSPLAGTQIDFQPAPRDRILIVTNRMSLCGLARCELRRAEEDGLARKDQVGRPRTMADLRGNMCILSLHALPFVPIVQRPRTWPFQGQNTGSNPVGDAT